MFLTKRALIVLQRARRAAIRLVESRHLDSRRGVYVVSPHGSFAAGAIALAARVYEFTPVKQVFRRRRCENVRAGFEFGLYCVGSCICC